MNIPWRRVAAASAMVSLLALAGCSVEQPDESPTVSASPSASVTAEPSGTASDGFAVTDGKPFQADGFRVTIPAGFTILSKNENLGGTEYQWMLEADDPVDSLQVAAIEAPDDIELNDYVADIENLKKENPEYYGIEYVQVKGADEAVEFFISDPGIPQQRTLLAVKGDKFYGLAVRGGAQVFEEVDLDSMFKSFEIVSDTSI